MGEHEGASVNPNFQATPIKIGNRLYTSTSLGQAVALDPNTGEEIWRYDPYSQDSATFQGDDQTAAWPTGMMETMKGSFSGRGNIWSRSTPQRDNLIQASVRTDL